MRQIPEEHFVNGGVCIDEVAILILPENDVNVNSAVELVSSYNYSDYDYVYAQRLYNSLIYSNVSYEDIFTALLNTVSSFFNTEFIPGFKLWYFLLIGLGCAIVGIGLKFFFGG